MSPREQNPGGHGSGHGGSGRGGSGHGGSGHGGGRDRGARRGGPADKPGTGRVRFGGAARDRDVAKRSAQRPSERAREADVPRRVAFETLRAVSEGAYANLELPGRLREAGLHGRDAAFVTELVYGVTRMRGLYDAIIERCAGRPLAQIDPPVLDVLRLGAHQLLGMRVPPHAAVDGSVALARSAVGFGASSFTNAVLRRVSESSLADWLSTVAPGAGRRASAHGHDEPAPFVPPTSLDDVAVARSHPAWIVRALRQALLAHGASTPDSVDADLLDLLHAHNVPADVTLVARPGLAEVAELEEAGAEQGRWSPISATLTHGGDPGSIPAVRQTRAAVQDEGSQLLVLALLHAWDALHPAAGRPAPDHRGSGGDDGPRWLDMAAGPGGKAALLAAASIPRGATLFANEVSEHRAGLVEATVRAAMDRGADVFVGVGDGRTIGREEPAAFDLVLLDAPCTGLGALRRRPDARWRRHPGDVADLSALQEELLASGLDALAPGGVLAYATCSPHDVETLQVVRRVLRGREDVVLLDATEHLAAVAVEDLDLPAGPFAQLWPHRHGTDAMFLALLSRN